MSKLIQISVGPTEFRYLLAGNAVGFHQGDLEIKIALAEPIDYARIIDALAQAMNPQREYGPRKYGRDPPEAREFLPVKKV
jgi:hypothetical protein